MKQNEINNIILKYLENKSIDDKLLEIKKELGEEEFIKLLEKVEKENKHYLIFSFFRNKEHILDYRQNVLNTIYSKVIVVNNYKQIEKSYENILDFQEVISVLGDVTDFCIKYNKPGKEIVNILVENYKVPLEVCQQLEDIYDTNIINLKLDYIINKFCNN